MPLQRHAMLSVLFFAGKACTTRCSPPGGERSSGIREALTARRRGPKSKHNPFGEEVQQLRRQVGRLTEKLRKAEIIIDVQKKVAALLGNPFPTFIRTRNPDVCGHRTGDRRGHQRGGSRQVLWMRGRLCTDSAVRGSSAVASCRGLRRHEHSTRRNGKRSSFICTTNVPGSFGTAVYATFFDEGECIIYSIRTMYRLLDQSKARFASAAKSRHIRPTRSRNCWPQLRINFGAGI